MKSVFLFLAVIFLLSGATAQPAKSISAKTGQVLLPRSTPEAEGISSKAVLDFVEAADQAIDAMNGLIIVRHGKVIAEGWWKPYDAKTPHILYSLSKSFTSTAVGLAISEGKLSLDDQVIKFFPEETPVNVSNNLKSMRIRDLLRMQTGHQSEPQFFGPASSSSDTWVRKFLNHPVPFKPGTHFLYNSPATYMLSAILRKVTGVGLVEYLRPRLFAPLGFEDVKWVESPQGIAAGAYGLSATTEEIAKFGQLYLGKGNWQGSQLIPADWVAQATALQTSNGSSPLSDWDQGYGYQFWRSRNHAYRGDGAFGQYCLVIPEQDTVIAIHSGVKDMQKVLNLVWDNLLPEFKSTALKADQSVNRKLLEKLKALEVKTVPGRKTSGLSAGINGRWYTLEKNDRGLTEVSFEDGPSTTTIRFRTSTGESSVAAEPGRWHIAKAAWSNGLDQLLSVPEKPMVASTGAWTSEDTFTLKLLLPQTPFYSTLRFSFSGDGISLESEHNVSFAPTKQAIIVGKR